MYDTQIRHWQASVATDNAKEVSSYHRSYSLHTPGASVGPEIGIKIASIEQGVFPSLCPRR